MYKHTYHCKQISGSAPSHATNAPTAEFRIKFGTEEV